MQAAPHDPATRKVRVDLIVRARGHTRPRRVRAHRRRVSMCLDGRGSAKPRGARRRCRPDDVSAVELVRASRSLPGLPCGTAVPERNANPRGPGLVPADGACAACRAGCARPVPRSVSLLLEHRLRDGDNVVNSICATVSNRSRKRVQSLETVRYVRANEGKACGKTICPRIMSARFPMCRAGLRCRVRICRCAMQKDIPGQCSDPCVRATACMSFIAATPLAMCIRNMTKIHGEFARKCAAAHCVFRCIH
jgi:hypothetical protein